MAEENVKKTNKAVKFFKDLKREMKNIVWSPKKDVVKNTTVVIVVTAIVAVPESSAVIVPVEFSRETTSYPESIP